MCEVKLNEFEIRNPSPMKSLLQIFSSESSGHPAFWIFPKLYEFRESCPRNPLETLE